MKRLIAILLILSLTLCSVAALAAGKLSVQQENFHLINGYGLYGYVFAKVANVGDRPIMVNTGLLEIFDVDGNALTSTDYFRVYAKYLQPGEYTYMEISDEIENVESSAVDDYMLTTTGKSNTEYVSRRLPCTTSYEPNVKSEYSTYDYMYATIINDTNEPIYGINVVMALLDNEGNILYIDDASMGSSIALLPGSSITVRSDVSSSFITSFEERNIIPVTVDAIAYVNERR